MSDVVKVFTVDQLPESMRDKIKQFAQSYHEKTTQNVDYIVHSPGRVNLIGDHIDYHGFAVLPMAIENSIWVGCSIKRRSQCSGDAQKGTIKIFNQDGVAYSEVEFLHSFSHGPELDRSHRWYNYILCGYHGMLTSRLLGIQPHDVLMHAKQSLIDRATSLQADEILRDLCDLTVYVDSDLTPASGLSSSSALVCASAVATCLLLHESSDNPTKELSINCKDLAEGCSKFEHLIGTHGGGMDQAVILTAQKGYAKLVEFTPSFNCENIQLPKNITWLISHCGSDYPKAATSGFNMRVLETKLAAAMIVRKMNNQAIPLDKTITLAEVKSRIFQDKTTDEIIALLRDVVFERTELSLDEILSQLGLSKDSLIEKFDTSEQILAGGSQFKLFDRCRHVFEEAERVEKFKSICNSDGDIVALGRIMTESHYSLKDNYECSHDHLDRLVRVAIDAGALGARLTGAGWGGCTVTLVEKSKCNFVMEQLMKYSKFTFRTEPQDGCKIIKI